MIRKLMQFVILLPCIFICVAPQICSARSAHYLLTQQKTPEHRIVLRLLNRDNRVTVWRQNVLGVDTVQWSSDHKAMAASFESSSGIRILVWQQGKPAYVISGPNASKGWGYEDSGVLNFAWSPDNCRLLYRPWGSGEKDMGIAKLICLDVSRRKVNFIADNVRKMQWIGNHKVRYWIIKAVEYQNNFSYAFDPHPLYWNCL